MFHRNAADAKKATVFWWPFLKALSSTCGLEPNYLEPNWCGLTTATASEAGNNVAEELKAEASMGASAH